MVGWGAMWSVCYGGGILVKVIAVVRAACCWRGRKKVLAKVVVQDLPKFSVSTSEGLTVVLWKCAVACYCDEGL